MPGWPTVDRAGDQRLVDALRRGDADAPALLHDAYAERLYDYAYSLTREGNAAADAVHDALVTAHGRVDRLRETARLRAWLYALTRFQAVARLAHRSGGPARGTLPAPALDDSADEELAALVREALGELFATGREVLGLSLRHGLAPAEAGAALGLTSRQAATRLGRARDHLENAAAAVVLARVGRAHCPDLSAMLDSWEGPLTSLLRRRLSGHISGCEVCTEGRRRQVAAGRLLGMVPVAYPPISLRRRVIDTCLSPALGDTRGLIMARCDSFDRAGFPVVVARRRRRPRGLAPVAIAGVCVLAATGAMVVANGGGATPTGLRVVPTATTSGELPAGTGITSEPEPAPVADLTPGPTPSPTGSGPSPRATRPAATAATTRPATGPATGPAATRRPAPRARLGAACPRGLDGHGDTAKVALRARNATVTWNAGATDGLDVFPASGSIRAGGTAAVWVTVDDPDTAGSGTVSFTSNGGGTSCSLSWRGRTPDSPPPSDDPTLPPDETGSPSDPPHSPAQPQSQPQSRPQSRPQHSAHSPAAALAEPGSGS